VIECDGGADHAMRRWGAPGCRGRRWWWSGRHGALPHGCWDVAITDGRRRSGARTNRWNVADEVDCVEGQLRNDD
jgi:hypothetical protein